ncbi:fructose-1,6-bisphosphatase [Enterococcus sp. 669A]|uniref:Fructose-1,6-bisphosphatase class 3 n=1 Tax=Candidatus Enterococcus moelleringii TaxID=2815325 RepID=A0ABS3LER7_9ENTE|nr:fructose-1,6-bisphosphatase [Enterococcus sp. 669A]MBO1307575.1 fructose-1,6-bisphosphatase [Enterococcus sp. 669A]
MLSTREKYYQMLEKEFNTKEAILTELINLEAIMHLPKGTELYVSDIHGEYDAFNHILRTGAGNIKEKISDLFQDRLTIHEKDKLTILVAYPREALNNEHFFEHKDQSWYRKKIRQLLELLSYSAIKYTRSKVRKALPKQYAYIIEELMYTDTNYRDKADYFDQILSHLLELDQGEHFIVALCNSIQRLVLDHLHVVGDIYDRGPAADKIMDRLCQQPSVDVQWGNHDILWMGAYGGSRACLMTLLRIAARYNYLYEIEQAYALNLRPLFMYAEEHYQKNPVFTPKEKNCSADYSIESLDTLEKVHQALSILQFKLEGQLIKRHPEFEMEDRLLFDQIDFNTDTIDLAGETYPLQGSCFQTLQEDPYELTEQEYYVVDMLMASFQQSAKMQEHMNFLLDKGSMYLVYNQHLLFHGCIPLDDAGNFLPLKVGKKSYEGKALLEFFEDQIRLGCAHKKNDNSNADWIWYCWTGKISPQFGKTAMTTFERYFIADKKTHVEVKNSYYSFRDKRQICEMILEEFGLYSPASRIINGHTPVKVKGGESPIKGEGMLFVIDGGLSKAYQKTTGIAGYSLLNNSYGFQLVTHEPFTSVENLLEKQTDETSLKKVIDQELTRILIKDTTVGLSIEEQIENLTGLLLYQKS